MELERSKEMIEIVMEVDDEFWNIINQLKEFKEQKEIIHCKECKYFSQNDRWCERYECDEGCSLICWDLGEDGFCSKAEERINCKDCKYFKLGKCYWRGDFEEAEKMNGVEIIREYPQPTNMNDWCGNGERK